jgi:heme/copper-type cytochrome/quinol oxidase subunit 2
MDLPSYLDWMPPNLGFHWLFSTGLCFMISFTVYYGGRVADLFGVNPDKSPEARKVETMVALYMLSFVVVSAVSYVFLLDRWREKRHAPHAPEPLLGCKKCEAEEKIRVKRATLRFHRERRARERTLREQWELNPIGIHPDEPLYHLLYLAWLLVLPVVATVIATFFAFSVLQSIVWFSLNSSSPLL